MGLMDSIGGAMKGGAEIAGGLGALETGNIGGIEKLAQGVSDMKNGLMGMGATPQQANDIVSKVLSQALEGQQGQQGQAAAHHHHHHQQQQGLPQETTQQLTQMLEQMMQQEMQNKAGGQ